MHTKQQPQLPHLCPRPAAAAEAIAVDQQQEAAAVEQEAEDAAAREAVECEAAQQSPFTTAGPMGCATTWE